MKRHYLWIKKNNLSKQSNLQGNDTLFNDDTLNDDQEGESERYDNFDEPVLQFYRRLNDVLTQTRKEDKMREALEPGFTTSNARKSIGSSNIDIDVEQSARKDGNDVF